MRFKREVEFSVDDDDSLWLYLDGQRPGDIALNLTSLATTRVIADNLMAFRHHMRESGLRLELERIRDNTLLPEKLRDLARRELS